MFDHSESSNFTFFPWNPTEAMFILRFAAQDGWRFSGSSGTKVNSSEPQIPKRQLKKCSAAFSSGPKSTQEWSFARGRHPLVNRISCNRNTAINLQLLEPWNLPEVASLEGCSSDDSGLFSLCLENVGGSNFGGPRRLENPSGSGIPISRLALARRSCRVPVQFSLPSIPHFGPVRIGSSGFASLFAVAILSKSLFLVIKNGSTPFSGDSGRSSSDALELSSSFFLKIDNRLIHK